MGIGHATGDKRAEEAAKMAINSPLLDLSIDGAKGVLFAIAGGDDMTMIEIQEAAGIITESIDPEAKVIFGAIRDPKLKKGEIKVTVIATGFSETVIAPKRPQLFPQKERPKEVTRETSSTDDRVKKIQVESANSSIGVVMDNKKGSRGDESKKTEPEVDEDWSLPAFLRRQKGK
jgi:cell division protein FtsZ